jgi:hypothetical protein
VGLCQSIIGFVRSDGISFSLFIMVFSRINILQSGLI